MKSMEGKRCARWEEEPALAALHPPPQATTELPPPSSTASAIATLANSATCSSEYPSWSIVSLVEWMLWSLSSKVDSIVNPDGTPTLLHEAWSEHA